MAKGKVILRFARMSEKDEHERTQRVCDILKKHFVKNSKYQDSPEEQNLRKAESNEEE